LLNNYYIIRYGGDVVIILQFIEKEGCQKRFPVSVLLVPGWSPAELWLEAKRPRSPRCVPVNDESPEHAICDFQRRRCTSRCIDVNLTREGQQPLPEGQIEGEQRSCAWKEA
jgi:hypothetical protein